MVVLGHICLIQHNCLSTHLNTSSWNEYFCWWARVFLTQWEVWSLAFSDTTHNDTTQREWKHGGLDSVAVPLFSNIQITVRRASLSTVGSLKRMFSWRWLLVLSQSKTNYQFWWTTYNLHVHGIVTLNFSNSSSTGWPTYSSIHNQSECSKLATKVSNFAFPW